MGDFILNKIFDIELKIDCNENEDLDNISTEIRDALMNINYKWPQINIRWVEFDKNTNQ